MTTVFETPAAQHTTAQSENQTLRQRILSKEFKKLKTDFHWSVLDAQVKDHDINRIQNSPKVQGYLAEIEKVVPRSSKLPAAVELWAEIDHWMTYQSPSTSPLSHLAFPEGTTFLTLNCKVLGTK